MAGFDVKAQIKMKKSKSEITMLMIVGLVLFVIVSLVLYLAKSSVKKQSQQATKKSQETAIELQPIREFVDKCLDKTAKDAVVLLGKQGGYIYASQGGTLIDYAKTHEGLFFIRHENLNVAYNIMPPKFPAPPYASDVPDYPWKTFPYETEISNAEIYEGFFGTSNLPPLNSSEGPNSMQAQIEAFVNRNMAKCLDFSIFREQGIEVEPKEANTSVIIGVGGVSVKAKMPIAINNPSSNEFLEISDFSATLDIRLRELHLFVRDLIGEDIKNIKFDIGNANNSQNSFRVKTARDIFSKDDLVTVTDEKSLVYGSLYEYKFSRRNRAPALHYIRPHAFTFPQGYKINETDLLQNKQLKAYDPDEDNYTFTIFDSELGKDAAEFPETLVSPQMRFRVEVSDGKLRDYQILTVNRE